MTPLPRTYSRWAELLTAQQLPSISPARDVILTALEASDPSATKLASAIAKDPVLAFYILSAANKAFAKRGDSVRTLTKAINVLGLGQTQQLALHLPHLQTLDSARSRRYAHAINVSLLAARIAHALSPQHQPTFADEMYWCALLQGVPFWQLYWHAGEELDEILAVTPRLSGSIAERTLLGCNLAEIAEACLKQMPLPEATQKSMPPLQAYRPYLRQLVRLLRFTGPVDLPGERPVEDRELKQLLQQPCFIVGVSNMLAWEAMENWYSRRTAKGLALAAILTKESLANSSRHSHRLAAELSRELHFPGAMASATGLIFTDAALPPRRTQPAAEISLPPPNPTPLEPTAHDANEAVPDVLSGDQFFHEITQTMLTNPAAFQDIAQLMSTAAKAAAMGIGFQRVVIALVNKQRTCLKGTYSTGAATTPDFAQFQIDLDSPSLFRKLTEKSAAVWIKPNSSSKLLSSIPRHFRQLADRNEFLLMSIFTQDRPVAVIYVDHSPGMSYSERDYERFKFLCQALSYVLRQMVQRKQLS